MKAIPKEHLLLLIEQCCNDTILKTDMDKLFELYGDDVYKDSSWGPFKLTNTNKNRMIKMQNIILLGKRGINDKDSM